MFQWGTRTYVMGIVNVTPDSFSGDGVAAEGEDDPIERAVTQARRFAEEGADVLDIGGESTRPGSRPVTAAEEKSRVIPVIASIRAALPQSVISVDTYRADVAALALDAGADWVNDVWGLRMDPAMAELIAGRGCPIIIMHNRSKPKDAVQEARLGGRYVGIHYANLMADIKAELSEQIDLAVAAGVRPERIIIDPGIGFGKTVPQNLEILDRMNEIKALGFPLLSGPSRKSFIGYTLDLPPDQRLEGTAAAVAISIDRGADIVRVHDVGPMIRIARMTDAIVRRR
ncbi:MAG: dihydropteroate synthase [Anaerolineales bacterium]|uniref:dihydropteroate synthase n=1 Tax=Promineifilum sp. TaxID=2664178 RepID=UPI001D451887|nr:dihydropteroate synthase [Anaerolineales bacterium]MCB8934989.1 dihydropteroate synthase [Promineifilum sp.]MCO5181776.1 dihydropteroate synthase [Promineifilum sp.]